MRVPQIMDNEILKTPQGYLRYLVGGLGWLSLAVTFTVFFAALISQGSTLVIKYIVDTLETGVSEHFYWVALLFPLSLFATSLLYRLVGVLMVHFSGYVKERSSTILFSYLLDHGKEYFSDRQAGAVLSKVNNVADSADRFLEYAFLNYFDALVTFIATLVILFWVSPWASGVYFVLAVVVIFCNIPLTRKKTTLAEASSKALTTLRGYMVDVFTNAEVVSLYAGKNNEAKQVADLAFRSKEAEVASGVYSEKILLLNAVLFLMGFVTVVSVLLAMRERGLITVGDLVMVMVLISQNTYVILFFGNALQRGAEHFGQLKEGLSDVFVEHKVIDDSSAMPLTVKGGKIEWNNVSFRFGENQVFDQFSLTIEPGQRIGLVGSSGAGKSTFVSLLLRQHDLDGGEIVIDGQDIVGVTQESLRTAIAVVPQEPLLFHRSIKENIVYGMSGATNEEMESVAKRARAHEFIEALPDKYNTLVGERGVKLSGGQRQRIAIARAMLKRAPILVLDEATSALDSESEVEIQAALHALMVGKTVIAIAHRLSTLREMDRIIVLDGGKIVEDGSHDDLLLRGGLYARLWTHQSGGFV